MVQAVRSCTEERKLYSDIESWVFGSILTIVSGVNLRKQNVYFYLVLGKICRLTMETRRWIYFLRIRFSRTTAVETRFVPFLAAPRATGRSQYGLRRLVRLAVDGMLSVIPGMRFACLCVGIAMAGVLSCTYLHVVVGISLFVVLLILLVRFCFMATNRILDCLETKEAMDLST